MFKLKEILNSKFCKITLAGLMALSAFPAHAITAQADSKYTINETTKLDEWRYSGYKWDEYGYDYGSIITVTHDGKTDKAFCLEPDLLLTPGDGQIATPSDVKLTEAQLNTLSLIAWYGYRSKENPTDVDYIITQNAVWKYVYDVHGVNESKRSYMIQDYDDDKYTEKVMMEEIDKIMQKVNAYSQLPEFDKTEVSLKAGESVTLTDTKGVLDNYKIVSKNNHITITQKGNQLTIKADEKFDKPEKVELEYNPFSADQTSDRFILRNETACDQGISDLRGTIPNKVSLNVKFVETSKPEIPVTPEKPEAPVEKTGMAILTKVDSENSKIVLSHAKFQLFNDKKLIGEYETDKNGKIQVKDLKLGEYYFVEKVAPKGYDLNTTKHPFTISETSLEVKLTVSNHKTEVKKTEKPKKEVLKDNVVKKQNKKKAKDKKKIVKTSDNSEILLYGSMLMLSLGVSAACLYRKSEFE